MKITILLSTYNGAKYLREQIDSILAQDNIKDINVLARDDGSSDGTQDILEEYAKNNKNFSWYQGENVRPARSFWDLLCKTEDSDFYAFADQDDVWDHDKVKIAYESIKDFDQSKPALYIGDVRTVDGELNLLSPHMVERGIPFDYPHALIKDLCPGCTQLFNKATRDLAVIYDPVKYNMYIHDWTIYLIATCFGSVYFDEEPHMSYRQHGKNVMGANKNGLRKIFDKLKKGNDPIFVGQRKRYAFSMEDCYGHLMNEDNLRYSHMMGHYTEDKKLKRAILKEPAFKSKGIQYLYFKHRVRVGKF